MKKLFALLLTLVLAFAVVACTGETTTEEQTTVTTEAPTTVYTGPLADAEKNYWGTGQFAGWGDAAGNTDYQMEAIAAADPRVADLGLENVEMLYLLPITLSDEDAGWAMNYIVDGVNTTLNGNLAVKIIRTAQSDGDNIPEWWAQSPESGEMENLTPETLFVPEFVETATTSEVDGETTYTSGAWNDNPAALAAGSYYFIFAEFEDGSRGMGLVDASMASADKNFWATGQFADWGNAAGNEMYKMEAVACFDPRVSSLNVEGAELIYLLEVELSADDAGWAMSYIVDGVNTTLNGNLAVKIIRTAQSDGDNIPEWWAQSPESGEMINLTPATLFVPEFVESATTSVVEGETTFTSGAWNDNPAALAAGSYYFVFVQYEDGTRGMGLVEVPAPVVE